MTKKKQIALALDVMGTDKGPGEIIRGGIDAARDLGDNVKIVLIGRRDIIEPCLKEYNKLPSNVEVSHAPEIVTMDDVPSEAVRRTDTSIAEAFRLHREKIVDAVVSPGNTGAVMGTAMLRLGRLREVKRPAIVAFFPSRDRKNTVVLDVGANAVCKPLHMYQFGVMGSIFAAHMFGIEKPRVGLVSIGEERSKGNDLIMESYALLEKNKALNFVGNIEGRDILGGTIDVAVTDGFTGNVVLKFAESVEGFLTASLRHQISTNIFSRCGALLMYPFLRRLRNSFDYSEYGGAPLLGINGVCIICHGGSSSKAITTGLKVAMRMVKEQVNQHIEKVLTTGSGGEGLGADFNRNGAYKNQEETG